MQKKNRASRKSVATKFWTKAESLILPKRSVTITDAVIRLEQLHKYFSRKPLQDTTFTSLKSLLNILKCSTREFSLAPNVLFFVLLLPICMF